MKKSGISAKGSFADQIASSYRLVNYYWKQLMSQTGIEISSRQWVAMDRLYHNGEMFQKDFVDEAYDDRPTVANMISSLEKKGLITKEPDSVDKRKHRIQLTSHGEKLHHKISKIVENGRKKMYKNLTKKDLIELKRILGKLKENITEE